jgi:hypothetical protein
LFIIFDAICIATGHELLKKINKQFEILDSYLCDKLQNVSIFTRVVHFMQRTQQIGQLYTTFCLPHFFYLALIYFFFVMVVTHSQTIIITILRYKIHLNTDYYYLLIYTGVSKFANSEIRAW